MKPKRFFGELFVNDKDDEYKEEPNEVWFPSFHSVCFLV